MKLQLAFQIFYKKSSQELAINCLFWQVSELPPLLMSYICNNRLLRSRYLEVMWSSDLEIRLSHARSTSNNVLVGMLLKRSSRLINLIGNWIPLLTTSCCNISFLIRVPTFPDCFPMKGHFAFLTVLSFVSKYLKSSADKDIFLFPHFSRIFPSVAHFPIVAHF